VLNRYWTGCPAEGSRENYIVVEQDGVSASDYQDDRSTPSLSRWLSGKPADIQQTIIVSDVVGIINAQGISERIIKKCGGSSITFDGDKEEVHDRYAAYPRVYTIKFPTLPAQNPADKLAEYDSILSEFIQNYFTDEQWTVLYTTTPRDELIAEDLEVQSYEMDEPFLDAVNMEMKRDVESHAKDGQREGGLFEKYQFLSPGIFMGLTASLPLLLILYVGVSAISGLEVSYFAFSKEMGPAGQKK